MKRLARTLFISTLALTTPSLSDEWSALPFEPTTLNERDPKGIWTAEEISETAMNRDATVSAYVATTAIPAGSLTVSAITGGVCTLQECPVRVVIENDAERLSSEYPVYLCQDYEGFEIRADPPALRACGVEIDLTGDVVRTSFGNARDFRGEWAIDRQCLPVDTVSYDAETYQSDFIMCRIEQTERTGPASWKLESQCGYEDTRSILMHDVFLNGNVMTQMLIGADLIPQEQRLFRC